MYEPFIVLIFVWVLAMVFAHSAGHQPSRDKWPSAMEIETSEMPAKSTSNPAYRQIPHPAEQTPIPNMLFRGGPSIRVFHASDLPVDVRIRDRVSLAVMGSPDKRQSDVIGVTS